MAIINQIGSFLKEIIKVGSPIIMLIFSAIVVSGMIKWGYKIADSLRMIFRNPILVIFWIAVSAFGIWLLYKFVFPYF